MRFRTFVKLRESDDDSKVEAWKEAVRKAHPEFAAKMRFKSSPDGESLEAKVNGLDRIFGIFDIEKMTGEVLE